MQLNDFRVATWQDHLFLLSHILRCPGGVSNWARNFVQVPVSPRSGSRVLSASPLNDPYLDHHHPRYTPLEKVPDEAVKAAGLKFASGDRDANFRQTFANPPELKRRIG